MNKTLAAIACCLLLATTVPMGSANDNLGALSLQQQVASTIDSLGPVETAPTGTDYGCVESNAWYFAYGNEGTPSGPCNYVGYYNFDLSHLYIDCAAYCFAEAFGFDTITWNYAYAGVFCPEGGNGIVDFTTGETTWFSGSCETYTYNNVADLDFYTYGYGQEGVKFSFTDNLLDAVLKHVL
jgi:hypothetical protein